MNQFCNSVWMEMWRKKNPLFSKYLTTNVLDWLPCCSWFSVFLSTKQLPQRPLKTSRWSRFVPFKKKTQKQKRNHSTPLKHLDQGSPHVVLVGFLAVPHEKTYSFKKHPHYLCCPVFANIILSQKTQCVCKWILENVDHFKRFSELKH